MLRFLAIAWILVLGSLTVSAEPVDAGHAVVELVSERKEIAPGDKFLAAFKMDIDEGWHVYWRNAGDAGIAPSISWADKSGAIVKDFAWPAPHLIPLETLMNYGYESQLILPFEVTAPDDLKPGDSLQLTGKADWQICLDVCIWEDAPVSLNLPVGDKPALDTDTGGEIAKFLATTPKQLVGEAKVEVTDASYRLSVQSSEIASLAETATLVRFFPYQHEIEHFPVQPARIGEAGITLDLTPSNFGRDSFDGLDGIVVVETEIGPANAFELAANIGPVLVGTDERVLEFASSTSMSASLASLPVWLFFAFLGGLILNLMPCVLPVLSIKANGLVHAAQKGNDELRAHGIGYLAGVLVCFIIIGIAMVVLRAAGESVGLGFQLQYPPIVLALAFLMYAIGLNLFGVFEVGGSIVGLGDNLANKSGVAGAFFTGLLAAIVGAPCVGPLLAASLGAVMSQPAWVVILFLIVMGLGMAAPFVLLSFLPGLVRYLPKPGAWMETLRQFLAFPMFLTAIWLLWVFAGQTSSTLAIVALTGAVLFSFGLWLIKKAGAAKLGQAAGGVVALVAIIAPISLSAHFTNVVGASEAQSASSSSLPSEAWSTETVERLRGEGRVVFVDFTARWCVTCQMNKKLTLESAEVKRAFAEHNVAFLTADWTNRDETIAKELAKHGRAGVPLYLLYPTDGSDPAILPQILSSGLVVQKVRNAVN